MVVLYHESDSAEGKPLLSVCEFLVFGHRADNSGSLTIGPLKREISGRPGLETAMALRSRVVGRFLYRP